MTRIGGLQDDAGLGALKMTTLQVSKRYNVGAGAAES